MARKDPRAGGPSGPSGRSGRPTPTPKSPRGVGRPAKLTEDTIAALEAVFRVGGTKPEACAAAGIAPGTLGTWLLRADLGHGGAFAELRRRLRAAEGSFRSQLRAAIIRGASDRNAVHSETGDVLLPGRRGDWRAAAALLERLDRHGLLRGDEVEEAPVPGTNRADVPDVIDAEELAPDADDAAVLEARVRTYRRQIAAASADGNHDAVAALTRRVERAEDELRAMRRAAGNVEEGDPAQLAEDELVWQIRTAAEAMPEAHLRAVVDVYLDRHRMRLVRDEGATNKLLAASDEN